MLWNITKNRWIPYVTQKKFAVSFVWAGCVLNTKKSVKSTVNVIWKFFWASNIINKRKCCIREWKTDLKNADFGVNFNKLHDEAARWYSIIGHFPVSQPSCDQKTFHWLVPKIKPEGKANCCILLVWLRCTKGSLLGKRYVNRFQIIQYI